jgi:hypothetical protein
MRLKPVEEFQAWTKISLMLQGKTKKLEGDSNLLQERLKNSEEEPREWKKIMKNLYED